MKSERFIVEKFEWKDLEEAGYASVTDYCRYLVANHPTDLPNRLEIYRGEMLCMTVTDVTIAATLEPSSDGWTKYTLGSTQNARRSVAKPRGCVKNKKMSVGT